MKIGIFSDLHLDFSDWDYTPEPDVFYICAGDISEDGFSGRNLRQNFLDKHPGLFYIKGNHDYYRGSFVIEEGKMFRREGLKPFTIAGAPMWTKITTKIEWNNYTKCLADFSYTNFMSMDAYVTAHEIQRSFLENSSADIIVSHHAPTYQSMHPKYAGDLMNKYFMNDIDISSFKTPPKVWIHGHIHDPCWYYKGNTLVIANPRGYPGESNWFEYKPFILDLDNMPDKDYVAKTHWNPPFRN